MMTKINYQPWLQAVLTIAKHYRIEPSEERIRLQLDWNQNQNLDNVLQLMTRQVGLNLRKAPFSLDLLNPWRLPVMVEFNDGQVGVIDKADTQGNVSIQFSGDQGLSQSLSLDALKTTLKNVYILRPETSIPDARIDEYIKPYEANWFWSIVLRDWKRYVDIMFASLIANVLALATIIFSMQVYDRVVTSQSIPTLWVLAGGVLIAALFEFTLRVSRVYLSDIIGKRADLRVSDRVFGHALRIKNKDRSKSTGSFISQIRELEGVRELVTSTTISAIADFPFFFLFLVIFAIIGGKLFWVMLLVVPLMILPGILVQKKLAQLAQEGMRESSIRNAILVEAVQGIEDIKLLRAESRFQNQWNHMNEVSADIGMRQRKIVGTLMAWTQMVQGLTYAIVVLVGCFAVMDGEMTTGALSFVQEKKEGLDYLVLEGGVGFSGGQKQALLLARLLIRQPNILLLDEPTAAIDDVAEKQLIDHLKGWLAHRTLVVATHRRAVLELVDRIIVVNEGKIVMDGPRDQVLNQSTAQQKQVSQGGNS
ncbi:ABC transporter transmembrane domain-containing protein [Acinetobacter baumannii]